MRPPFYRDRDHAALLPFVTVLQYDRYRAHSNRHNRSAADNVDQQLAGALHTARPLYRVNVKLK